MLWFRPQNIRLVLVQLASLIDSSCSRNCGTWTSISRGSGGCRSRCGGGSGGGSGGGASRKSMPTMMSTVREQPKLRK